MYRYENGYRTSVEYKSLVETRREALEQARREGMERMDIAQLERYDAGGKWAIIGTLFVADDEVTYRDKTTNSLRMIDDEGKIAGTIMVCDGEDG